MDLKRPVPLWLFLVGLLAVSSASSGLFIIPKLLARGDFAVYIDPGSVSVRQDPEVLNSGFVGDANSSATLITVKSLNGFAGMVTLSASAPTMVWVRLGESSVLLGSDAAMFGLNVSVLMDVGAALLGNYTVTVSATSGSLSHSHALTINSQDVNVRTSQTSLSLQQGSSATSQVTFSSLNGFTGSLDIRQTPLSIFTPGGIYSGRWFVNGTISANSIRLDRGIASSVTFTASAGDFARPGAYNFSIIATYGTPLGSWSLSQQIIVNVALAPEPQPTLVSNNVNSGTNATLILSNGGPAAIMITSYTVSDSAGDTSFVCLGPGIPTGCSLAIIIVPSSSGRIDVLTNPMCGYCTHTGNPFTFQTGQSYAIALTTSRQHTFSYTIKG